MKPFIRWVLSGVIRLGTRLLCRIDRQDFNKIPRQGPLILVMNHIGSLEVPLIGAQLHPRHLVGLAKQETWNNWFMGWLFTQWEAIPVRRGEADMEAIRTSLSVLKRGGILGVAPEGTRSKHGRLLRGQPGIALLALKSDAPILPMAHWGVEKFSKNVKGLKRTDFHFRIGKPFYLDPGEEKVDGVLRRELADAIMYQIAALLPEEYRGEYATPNGRSEKFLRYA
jgi:1-acyl-sn-glycerol-3-phosphate acyltransferase